MQRTALSSPNTTSALRGAGELAGGKQWGVSDIAMEALKNIKLVEAARIEAASACRPRSRIKTIPPFSSALAPPTNYGKAKGDGFRSKVLTNVLG